ncbi:hypothetical protein PR202_ga17785 [Eleusine coracana subsp. coracana]|uniref:Glycosyltransferase n=1 Tax=Eleusine coracana subsp. coracana TaxID=191504 RepID=A0AAV5CRC8_ELECO|nr:hypothetical protein PR202_ga17538 [Eleusine coracana subsp. coracana]GJN00593.1 hypothetical protein PR202_ga17785 [Eleusine coracana subsp. coracana]
MDSQERAAESDSRGDLDVTGNGTNKTAHFVFVPLLAAQGHLIPAVDTALLLATHGAVCTIVGTPATAARVSATVASGVRAGLRVRLIMFPLDYAASGLPEGTDHMDLLPPEYMRNYLEAMAGLREPIESYLRAHAPRPTCVVSDFCHPWTTELAAKLGVPRLSFFSMCAFTLLCQHNVERFHAYDGVADDNEFVTVPGLEKRVVEVTRAQAPGFFRGIEDPWWVEFGDYVERARAEADGVIMNTFLEMEPDFVTGYASARKMKVWTVGPVSLYHQNSAATLATRGKTTAAVDAEDCLRWLDGKEPGSVIYVSFGSIAQANAKQAVELGLGLEASGHAFVWAVRNAEEEETVRDFLRELEARVAGRGLVVRGWAPQVLVLSHAAVGGFVTHCGWNSTLEAVAAGLPVVTWPHFADQFLNEKMAVDVLGIGVSVGVKEPLMYGRAAEKEIVVRRDVVEEAVRSVMGGGKEAEERRRRARARWRARRGRPCGRAGRHMPTCWIWLSASLKLKEQAC